MGQGTLLQTWMGRSSEPRTILVAWCSMCSTTASNPQPNPMLDTLRIAAVAALGAGIVALLIHNAVAYWSLPRHERARLMAESEED